MNEATILTGLKEVSQNHNLAIDQAETIMNEIMSGKVTDAQLGGFLTALRMKGETIDEIIGFARVMRKYAMSIKPEVSEELLDTCGTGGDRIKTFNISTISALVIAGAGVPIAKHGNRAVTSKCGSADLLEGLGVKIDLEPPHVKQCIEEAGIGFMFAPLFHPAMKYAMPTRRQLKIRTVFNILGPLTNPANAKCHVLGVFHKDLTSIMAKVLGALGGTHIFTVHNSQGIDELAPVGINYISEYKEKKIESYALTNEDFDIPECQLSDLVSNDQLNNLHIARKILKNQDHGARYNTVLMNAALGLLSVSKASDIEEGISIARNSIESGNAYKKLETLIQISGGDPSKLRI
ncbi:MAG: Anthranilate phosphoribosyltransferase [Promethearchaeota archaeon]|nr:MAG: Anthranilate phosphoribosyltransferase [Candidatus Lokiarchaeota archaeon]